MVMALDNVGRAMLTPWYQTDGAQPRRTIVNSLVAQWYRATEGRGVGVGVGGEAEEGEEKGPGEKGTSLPAH
jgi:hypothetical protein